MKTSRHTLTFLLIMLFAGKLLGQELILFEKTNSEAYLVRHQADPRVQPVANYFLETLAKGNGVPTAQTEFVLVHDEFLRLTRRNATQYQVYATLKGFRFTGTTDYRGFDMRATLMPTAVKYSMERLNANSQVIESWDFASVAMGGSPVVIANFQGTDSTGKFEKSTLRVRNKSFIYGKKAKLPFNTRVTLIDEYNAAGQELDGLYNELQNIDPKDIDHLEAQEVDLEGLREQTTIFRDADYVQRLQLSTNNDPANFLTRFAEIEALGAELERQITDSRARLPQLYYERGLAALQANDRPGAIAQFNLSLQAKPNFTPSLLELARVSYLEGDGSAATAQLLNLFSNFELDEATSNNATLLAGTIYQNDLGNAAYAVQQYRYADALAELEGASALCETVGPLACTEQLTTLRDQANRGLYQQLMALGAKKLQSGDRAGAEASAREAIALQQAQPAAIADAKAAQALLSQVMAANYAVLIQEGAAFEQQGQHGNALDRYAAAQALEAPYGLQVDPKLADMARRTAKVLVLADIATALNFAKSNQLRQARETQNALFEMRKQYALEADAEVAPAYEELQGAIFDQECTNALAAYEAELARAAVEVSAKRFIEAIVMYDAALKVAQENSACGLDITAARDGKAQHAPAASYQKQYNDVHNAVNRTLYREAIDGYLAAGNFHTENKIAEKFGMSHVDLFLFIQKSGRREFKRFGAEYYTNLEQYDSAIVLLREILDQGYKKGKLKALLVRIGSELAVRDHKVNPNADAKAQGIAYTMGNKKLKKLYKAYVKQFKRL